MECPNGRTGCRGHKHWHGGIKDGHVDCLKSAHPSDFPETFGTMLRHGQRSWYVRDHTAQGATDTEAHYRVTGVGACPPAGEANR